MKSTDGHRNFICACFVCERKRDGMMVDFRNMDFTKGLQYRSLSEIPES